MAPVTERSTRRACLLCSSVGRPFESQDPIAGSSGGGRKSGWCNSPSTVPRVSKVGTLGAAAHGGPGRPVLGEHRRGPSLATPPPREAGSLTPPPSRLPLPPAGPGHEPPQVGGDGLEPPELRHHIVQLPQVHRLPCGWGRWGATGGPTPVQSNTRLTTCGGRGGLPRAHD